MRLITATGRPLAALALLAALGACATTTTEPSFEPHPAGWRIVERTGEARYSPPGSVAWTAANTGQSLAGGSEVATGPGGRLIIGAPGRHLSVGPDSRFVLPDGEWEQWLDQRAGWLRYRIAEAGPDPFRIHTRSLELELSSGVVDVHVNHLATEVTVKEGQVRVATPDGLRQSQMIAGQSARAGGDRNTELAVRRGPGEALQPVDPVVLPAIQRKGAPARAAAVETRGGAAMVAPAPAPTPATAEPREPLARDNAHDPGIPGDPAAAGARSGNATVAAGTESAADRAGEAAVPAPSPTDPAAIRRGKFERLTVGMVDGIRPPHPAPLARRPFR